MPNRINIDHLDEADLIDLNHRIVARLKWIADTRTHSAMMAFRLGERVSFDPPGQPTRIGILTKYNRKSVTVITDEGMQWTVSPQLLRKVVDVETRSRQAGRWQPDDELTDPRTDRIATATVLPLSPPGKQR